MATFGLEGGERHRENHDLPLVPLIDFLLCLVAFLLVTAVWAEQARLVGTAEVPGDPVSPPGPSKRLHVTILERDFELKWSSGSTVVETLRVRRQPLRAADGSVRYPALERALAEQWSAHGAHRHPADPKSDEAVLHVPNSTEYGDLTAVLDALHAPKRHYASAEVPLPAFAVSFAVN